MFLSKAKTKTQYIPAEIIWRNVFVVLRISNFTLCTRRVLVYKIFYTRRRYETWTKNESTTRPLISLKKMYVLLIK